MSAWPPPSGGIAGIGYVDDLELAKSRPALSRETSYWETDPLTKGGLLFLGALVAQECPLLASM